MREWCGCGAGISGKPTEVRKWRKHHRHGAAAEEQHPPTSGTSFVQHAGQPIGFRPDAG